MWHSLRMQFIAWYILSYMLVSVTWTSEGEFNYFLILILCKLVYVAY